MDNNQLKDHLKVAIEFLRSADTESMKVAQASVQPISKKDELATFFIRISPTVNMTIDGNHPLVFIIQDLEALGTAKTYRVSCEELDRADQQDGSKRTDPLCFFSLPEVGCGRTSRQGN